MTFILKDRLPPTVSGKRRSSSHAGGGEVGGRGGGGLESGEDYFSHKTVNRPVIFEKLQ